MHAVHLVPQGPELMWVAGDDFEKAGREHLDRSVERARELLGDVPVTGEVRVGPVVPTIVDLAKDARMIVLERRDLSTVRRVVTRSVSSGVSARARVPVVSVPSRWSADHDSARGLVTVGVDVPERSVEVLRAALAAAGSRGAGLRVLHSWSFPVAYDDLVSREESQRWSDRATAEIQTMLDGLGDETAGVDLRIEVHHARAADALVAAGGDSDLLVLGRHDPLLPIGSHLGPIARAVLREADCPVLLVDPKAERGGWQPPQAVTASAQQPG